MARGRTRNTTPTVTVTLSTTPQVKQRLDQLAAIGHYGKNAADVAEQLLRLALFNPFSAHIDLSKAIAEAPASCAHADERRQTIGS